MLLHCSKNFPHLYLLKRSNQVQKTSKINCMKFQESLRILDSGNQRPSHTILPDGFPSNKCKHVWTKKFNLLDLRKLENWGFWVITWTHTYPPAHISLIICNFPRWLSVSIEKWWGKFNDDSFTYGAAFQVYFIFLLLLLYLLVTFS